MSVLEAIWGYKVPKALLESTSGDTYRDLPHEIFDFDPSEHLDLDNDFVDEGLGAEDENSDLDAAMVKQAQDRLNTQGAEK
jgi:hypothetical protein